MNELLDRLCERCGLVSQYHDIWGRAHAPSDAARRALLAAMGVAADDDAAIAGSLRELDRREWRHLLPPVLVLHETARPYRVVLTLPDAMQALRWRLRRESGGESGGGFRAADLEALEHRELDGQVFVRRRLEIDSGLAPGYHRFSLENEAGELAAMVLIVASATCYVPPALHDNGRAWGFAAQLYGVRSRRNWGMGDFGDLRRMLELCGESGAATVLLNPLHALFPDAPEHASPYSPSHRAWFNTLYLDVAAIPEFAECAEAQAMVNAVDFQARLDALRTATQVEYQGVAEQKVRVLALLHAHFRARHLAVGDERARAFRDFCGEHGDSLEKLALFEALQEHFHAADAGVWGWPAWPEDYRDPDSPAVAAFRAAHGERVEYFAWLQWLATLQLAAAGTRSWELGLGVGIMFDLAIGVAEGGAATWTRRQLYALGASTGAPPDDFNLLGQDWGLPPLIPWRLREAAYEPFIEVLRANMRYTGALRIDHVMGLFRLFWVARGLPAAEGTYIEYPFADLLGILALESQRNRCLVLGEDLGTVPDAVRDALHPMGVLSTRLLYFERGDDASLRPPQAYPAQAAAAVTSHDLPTLAGYWRGLDIELRERLHLFPDPEAYGQQMAARSRDRAQLLLALEHEGLLPAGASLHPEAWPELSGELAAAVYTYLARAPSKLILVQMEDAFGVAEQPNLPGTTEPTYPCWRLKLPPDLENWPGNPWLSGITQALRRERPGG
jgi:(1->4)-alpha-D-glucan 1-alpha-D-glucosylmutase